MSARPMGISILAILSGLFGIVIIILGVVVAALASAISDYIGDLIEAYAPASSAGIVDFAAIITALAVAFGVVMFIVGILNLLVAYGFWVGAGWSRWLAIILLILDIIAGIVTLPSGIVPIIIAGLILWYLMQPRVKAFFGAGPAPTPPPTPPS